MSQINCSNYTSVSYNNAVVDHTCFEWQFYTLIGIAGIAVYMTICGIAVFISGEIYKAQPQSLKTLLNPSNIKYLMSIMFIIASTTAVLKLTFGVLYCRFLTSATYVTDSVLTEILFVTVYMILWLRQTIFHTQPSLKHLSSKFLRVVSYMQGGFVLACGISLVIMTAYYGVKYNITSITCLPNWLMYYILIFQIETQLMSLLLFIFPIVKHARQMGRSIICENKQDNAIMKLMKRSVILTLIAVLSDISSYAVFFFTGTAMLYVANVIINLLCILFCFIDWRERLFPFSSLCKTYKKKKSSEQSTTNAQFSSGEV